MQNTITLYNTKERKKVPFIPTEEGKVLLYTCGPTVYNYAHIGNLRTYMFEDLLRRTLEWFEYDVKHVMNLTDVDDKTIKGAIAEDVSLDVYTAKYKEAFFEDIQRLNILPAHVYPAATDHVDQMIQMIEQLIAKGFAYVGNDQSVFFRIAAFHSYGTLAHLDMEGLKAGASERVAMDEYEKESLSDFVLWKSYDEARDRDVFWKSPWGKGRPGWHIECSAMAISHLGETLDIHCGGIDNIFPHHENEVAQSEGCTGKCFSKYWLHSAHLMVEGKKMSKSLGNFYTLRDLLDQGVSVRTLRWLLLTTHYRTELNFTKLGIEAAENSLCRIDDFLERLQEVSLDGASKEVGDQVAEMKKAFRESLADDLGISGALAALFDFIRFANAKIDSGALFKQDADAIISVVEDMDRVLGVLSMKVKDEVFPEDVVEAMNERQEARKTKDWAEADRLRDWITSRGFEIEDTPKGPKLKRLN